MNTRRFLASLCLALSLFVSVSVQAEPADIVSLRAKAEKGNAIAQYNLGLAYTQGRNDLPVDLVQAYVWLTLSGDSGSTRRTLADVLDKISDTQLATARRLLENYHGTPASRNLAGPPSHIPSLKSPVVTAPATPVVAKAEPPAIKVPEMPKPAATENGESDELIALRRDKGQLSDELALAWKENDKLKASLGAAQIAVVRAQQVNQAGEKRGQELTAAQSELKQANARVSELSGTISKLQDEIATGEAAAESARAKASAVAAAQASDLAVLNEKLAAVGHSAGEVTQARDTATKTAAQLAAVQAEAADLKTRLAAAESAQADAVADLASAHKENDTIKALAAASAAKSERYATERDTAVSAKAALVREKDALTAQLAEAKSTAKSPAAEAKAAALAAELETARREVVTQKSATSALTADLETARRDLAAKQSASVKLTTELESARREAADTRRKLDASEIARASAVEESHSAQSTAKVASGQLATLQERVKSLEAAQAARKTGEAQAASQVEKLTQELAAARRETASAEALATAAVSEKSRTAASLASTVTENVRLVTERDAAESARKKLADEKDALAAKLATEKDALASELAAAKADAQSAAATKSKAAVISTELETTRQSLADTNKKLASTESARATLAQQINPLQTQLQQARSAAAAANTKYDALQADRSGASSKVATLQSDLDKEKLARLDVVSALTQARTRLDELTATNLKLSKAAESAPSPQVAVDLAAARHELTITRDRLASLTAADIRQATALESAQREVEKSHAEVAALNEKLKTAGAPSANETRALADAARASAQLDQLQAELTKLRSDRQRVSAELATVSEENSKSHAALEANQADLATLRKRVTQLDADRTAAQAATGDAAQQRAQATALQKQVTELQARATASDTRGSELSAQLAAATDAGKTSAGQIADLKHRLSAYEAQGDLPAKLADLSAKQADSSAKLTALRSQVQSLESERTTLQEQLAAAKAAPATPSAAQTDAEAKLATSLRSYAVVQAENDSLKAASEKLAAEKTALERQLADAKSAPASANAAEAETEAKLATTLRSYSVLQSENESLKAARDQMATDKSNLETQLAVARAATEDTGAARDQLRQLQAQNVTLTSENAQLKTRLSLVPASSPLVTPSRIAANSAVVSAPTRPGTPFPGPSATPAQRTHIVVEGDTLAKISRLYYGNASRWPEILAANREALRDERSLVVGRTLVIP